MATVELNKPVPNFVAQATSSKDVLLEALRGWRVVIYFYPKDNTPGCTTEGQDFKEYYEDFLNLKTIVFGVSKDNLKSHEEFRAEYKIPFELIADVDGDLCKLFDVIRPQNMYGQQIMGLERSTFLIDEHGVLRQEWRKVRVNGHADEVFEAVESLIEEKQAADL